MTFSACISILNWNNSEDTIRCVESVINLIIPDSLCLYVILIDNCSTDNSTQNIKKWYEEKQLSLNTVFIKDYPETNLAFGCINQSTNLATGVHHVMLVNSFNSGYAGGNNLGIRFAQYIMSKYIWILNNDTWVDTLSFTSLIESSYLCNDNCIQGSTILEPNSSVIQCAGGCTFNKYFTYGRQILKGTDIAILDETDINLINDQIDYISGCSLFLPVDILNKVGLLEEKYFLYFEEVDFCIRAIRLGFKLKYVSESIIWHKEGSTINNSNDYAKKSLVSERYNLQGRFIFNKKFFPYIIPITFLTLIIIFFNRLRRLQFSNAGVVAKVFFLQLISFTKIDK